jgi:hypothetical protein
MKQEPDKPKKPEPGQRDPPDDRGDRPTDPNELAKWIVEQTTELDSNNDQST